MFENFFNSGWGTTWFILWLVFQIIWFVLLVISGLVTITDEDEEAARFFLIALVCFWVPFLWPVALVGGLIFVVIKAWKVADLGQ